MVAPGGSAVGLDLSEAMVTAAAQRFPAGLRPGLTFLAADVETVGTIAGAPFDAAFSRMVLMLLPDPVAGCTAIRRQLRPGGRLAATVFRDGAANPWLPAAVLGTAPHVGALPPLPVGAEPGPFAFADPAYVTTVLRHAGFDGILVEAHDAQMCAPDEPDAVADWLIDIGPAGAAYRAASAGHRQLARTGVARLCERYHEPGTGYRFPIGLWLIVATSPL
jgi:SAM-dependent methyltransferase